METKTPYNELDDELKNKLDPQLKESIDNFFKIDTNPKEGRHIALEEEDPEYVEKMLNKPLESEFSVEHTLDSFKQKVINIYRKILKRSPNNIELIHHSNMLRYDSSTEEEIENILENSDDYKKLYSSQQYISPAQTQIQRIPQTQLPQTQSIPEQHPDEYYISIIKKVYDEELQREADEGGLANYLKKMKHERMTEEKIRRVLRNSVEYRQNFGTYQQTQSNTQSTPVYQSQPTPVYQQVTTTSPNQVPPDTAANVVHFQVPNTLIYCMMGENRLNEIKHYIETVIPFVDKFIFIDGGSEDGTVDYLKSLGDKVEVYVHPWQDRFSEQRNHYLEKLRERNYNGFVITSDSDEHYPTESLKQIRDIIPELETKGYNGIKVQVEDIEVDDDNFNKVISCNVNRYWKPLIFKFHPNLRYEGEPHETITGYPIKWYKSNILYEHRRSKLHILSRACENYFISNSNRYSERWSELRFLCTKNEILTFKEYWNLFKVHKLPKEVEDWIYKHKDDNQDSGDSELRETALLYFEVLPERSKKHQESKESDSIYTPPILEKREPGIKTEEPETTPDQRLIEVNNILKSELNDALNRIEDLTNSSEKTRPSRLSEEAKKAIHNAITRAFENEDSIYEIVPPDNIYIVRIIKSEADIIENRNGEAIYRKIRLQE